MEGILYLCKNKLYNKKGYKYYVNYGKKCIEMCC